MRLVGMFEAKTHLPKIVSEAIAVGSEGICLTNRGQELAVIISIEEYRRTKSVDWWRRWEAVKKDLNLTPEEVIEFKNEGRR